MAKGIVAFVVVLALILSISMLSGIGFYSEMNVDYANSGEQDVQNAANAMIGQQAADKSSTSVLQDFTTSASRTLATAWAVIANLDGILEMLFGLPDAISDPIRLFFQMVFSVTFAAFIRGVVLQ
ncbi:MAG: hypothetical protein ABEI52_10695 [Halobacteriaceae archaeon]